MASKTTLWLGSTPFAVALYSGCSSLMLVCNKLAMKQLPFPTLVTGAQLAFCALVVLALHQQGLVSLGAVSWSSARPFMLYCSVFAFGIYSNMQVLERSTVGVTIATRSILPLLVCATEVLQGGPLPSLRALGALLSVGFLVVAYVVFDQTLHIGDHTQLLWLALWLSTLVFQMAYGKRMTVTHALTHWERVFLTNAFSLPCTFLLLLGSNETARLPELVAGLRHRPLHWVLASCVLGVGISFSGWSLRDKLTATAFSLVGVACKVGSILFSQLAFHDGTAGGTAALVLVLVASCLYEQEASSAPAASSGAAAKPPPGRVVVLKSSSLSKSQPQSPRSDAEGGGRQLTGGEEARV